MMPLVILVVDDDEHIRNLIRGWIEDLGHRVVCAANGLEADVIAHKLAFDLIITDVLMPEGDGAGLITKLKNLRPAARVLAISGGGRIIDSNDCLRIAQGLGAHAAVLKPFNRQQLLAAMDLALAPVPPVGLVAS